MDILKRELAPLAGEAWEEIDKRAIQVLKTHLSGRKVVHVQGPFGWNYTVLPEGRISLLDDGKKDQVRTGVYGVKPLIEARISFTLDRWEMDNLIRGARNIKLDPLDDAVKKIALFEEEAVYNGYPKGGIEGLIKSAETSPLPFGKQGNTIMESLSKAVLVMKEACQDGPFSLIVGEEGWKRVNTENQGYPLLKRIHDIIGGSVLYSSVLNGGLLLPHDHEDLELVIGGDFSIGYEHHDSKSVQLFISESFTFRVTDPAVIIPFTM